MMTPRPAPRWCRVTLALVARHARGFDGAMLLAAAALVAMMACRVLAAWCAA